jgi:xanthine/uracil permease
MGKYGMVLVCCLAAFIMLVYCIVYAIPPLVTGIAVITFLGMGLKFVENFGE